MLSVTDCKHGYTSRELQASWLILERSFFIITVSVTETFFFKLNKWATVLFVCEFSYAGIKPFVLAPWVSCIICAADWQLSRDKSIKDDAC